MKFSDADDEREVSILDSVDSLARRGPTDALQMLMQCGEWLTAVDDDRLLPPAEALLMPGIRFRFTHQQLPDLPPDLHSSEQCRHLPRRDQWPYDAK
jgi:hypothetical protein